MDYTVLLRSTPTDPGFDLVPECNCFKPQDFAAWWPQVLERIQ